VFAQQHEVRSAKPPEKKPWFLARQGIPLRSASRAVPARIDRSQPKVKRRFSQPASSGRRWWRNP